MFLVLLPFLEIKGNIEEFWIDWDRPKPELYGDDDECRKHQIHWQFEWFKIC